MGFNSNVFQSNPVSLDVSRSKLDLSHSWTGTFNTGLAVPMLTYCDVLPGDTFKLGMSMVIRSTTPIAPVMDNAFADVYFFFVPHKLTLSRKTMSPDVNDSNHSWAAIIGAQDNLLNMPLPDNGAELPVFYFGGSSSSLGFDVGSLADYMGLPAYAGTEGSGNFFRFINCLEPLAYYSVWNNYFRDPNTMNPVTYSIVAERGENNVVHLFGGSHAWTGSNTIGQASSILPVCRDHGYFGSALPWPQRNSTEVTLPLGDYADIVAGGDLHTMGDVLKFAPAVGVAQGGKPLIFGSFGTPSDAAKVTTGTDNMSEGGSGGDITRTNLRADLSTAVAANVNALRAAVQTQRWFEALARAGNRIQDVTGMFGVRPHDMGDDRPEYLGGRRIPIVVQQVTNTAGTSKSTTQQFAIGSTGAFSLTTDESSYFTKSFDTWGTIVGIICVRVHDSFHQGLARRYSRRNKFDFYWKQFANLGEQAILNKEIYFSGDKTQNDGVFGYQEAWAEYRFFPNMITGYARPGQNQAYWNYANNFDGLPTLSGFLDASSQKTNVDRTLQIGSSEAGFQWMANIYFDITAVRPMPLYSIPGLVDHH